MPLVTIPKHESASLWPPSPNPRYEGDPSLSRKWARYDGHALRDSR